jgi:DNA polymerase-3 subunit alpha
MRRSRRRRPTASLRWRSPTSPTCSAWSSSIPPPAPKASSPSSAAMSGVGEEAADRNAASSSRLLLLARNRAGYLRLCELLSTVYLAPRRHGRAEITRAQLGPGRQRRPDRAFGGPLGDIGQLLAAGKLDQADVRAQAWARLFPGAYYIEVQRPGGRDGAAADEVLVAASADLAARLGLPLVATHPVQFLDRDDFKAHEARVCIAEGYMLSRQATAAAFSNEQYFKTQRGDGGTVRRPAARRLQNSVEIARRCNLSCRAGQKPACLDFPTPAGEPLEDFIGSESQPGSASPGATLSRSGGVRECGRPQYAERLEFEIKTIVKMGFSGYFLIVADFINWAKHNGVPVGPRRGSGAGSLVAYTWHHRPRSACATRCCSNVSQSRTRVDAGLRHRLLPGRARPRHRLCQTEVWRARGIADRYLRHAWRRRR